jgi:hypothetical protein
MVSEWRGQSVLQPAVICASAGRVMRPMGEGGEKERGANNEAAVGSAKRRASAVLSRTDAGYPARCLRAIHCCEDRNKDSASSDRFGWFVSDPARRRDVGTLMITPSTAVAGRRSAVLRGSQAYAPCAVADPRHSPRTRAAHQSPSACSQPFDFATRYPCSLAHSLPHSLTGHNCPVYDIIQVYRGTAYATRYSFRFRPLGVGLLCSPATPALSGDGSVVAGFLSNAPVFRSHLTSAHIAALSRTAAGPGGSYELVRIC